ncbi:MAG: hypothetical protein DCF25_14100 [Leptolyngbya foveolarum]|uniref:DUF202 domain-containing protein n=1 Tax=Leptolyngbya foveolarum TaxID=47253 RepID=A0A2W4VZ87_9CYAN|nr:MAG: hypothetical protein DCF25_14100 [Leptolyngbya foveolarum]
MTFPRRSHRPPRSTDRQREHQANERTFLAWLRTSIALIGFGFAIARFGLFLRQFETATEPPASIPAPAILNSQTLGMGLVAFGITVIILAAWRYNQVFWQIERGDYKPSRLAIWILTSIITLLGLLSLPLLTGQTPTKRPPDQSSQR